MVSRQIKELRLRHFKAFEDARLPLDDLTVLVGRNGSGKTTLIEAFDFIRFAVTSSLSRAVDRAGGIAEFRQRRGGQGAPFDVSLAVTLDIAGKDFLYGFRIGSKKGEETESQWVVKEEVLKGVSYGIGFRRTETTFKSDISDLAPPVERDTLALPMVAGANKKWNAVWRTIRSVQDYNLSPEAIRSEPSIGTGNLLERDGRNTGDLLKSIQNDPTAKDWLLSHLSLITPGLVNVAADAYAGRRIIRFQQRGKTDSELFEFTGRNMSDGTLRALALLVALSKPGPSLIIADEIDDSLHPHAVRVLMGALVSKLEQSHVLVSTHDLEVLNLEAVTGQRIRVVDWQAGVSRVYLLKKKVIERISPLETVGELLRSNALFTEHESLENGKDFWSL